MLRANRRGFFRLDYDITDDGRLVTELTRRRREGCEFALGGVNYVVERTGQGFVLSGPHGPIADVERDKSGRVWSFSFPSGELTLANPPRRSAWYLHYRNDTGTLGRANWLPVAYSAYMPAALPMLLQVFAMYVFAVIQERRAQS